MKALTFIILLVFSVTTLASSGTTSCRNDDYASQKIESDYEADSFNLSIFNSNREVIGVIMLDGDKNPYSLYLCGNNSTYYYIKNTTLDDIKAGTFWAFNDEYEVELLNFKKFTEASLISFKVKVFSEAEDPDYPAFETEILVDLNVKKSLELR